MKKTIKASSSKSGFKAVASRKKRKSSVLKESIDNKRVAAKALSACSWSSETGDTMKSESIDMEEECLIEETSIDYDDSGTFTEGNPDQTPKGLHVKTKKVLGKPLGVIDYDTVDTEDDVLDDSLFLPPFLLAKLSVQVSVHKFFALDIDLVVVAGKSSHEKVNFASFTSKKAMMAAAQLANNHGVVVNTNFKCPINNCTNWAIVLKEIPVKTSIEAVRVAISEFGVIKSIKMQLVGLWQKAIIELEDQIQADLLTAEWSILIGKDAVRVAQADVDKQTWDARDEFRALLYTLPMGTNAHDLWDFIDSVGGKTCVIECSSLLVTPPSQNQVEDIVMGVDLDDATSDKTAAILVSTASPEVVKLENMLEGLSGLVMSLSAHLDSLALAESKLKGKIHPWLANKFDGVQVFTSGLDSGSSDAEMLIVMNSSLAKHVCKISEVSGRLLFIKLLFKNKLSVSILGLYAGASLVARSHKCASFKKCFDLGLINFLEGSSFVKSPTWYNSYGITKTIDYVFVSSNLVGAVVDCGVDDIEEYFNTNHKAIYVSVGLGGLLDVQLNSLHK
ncbi:hypothetical protein G9A89_022487 [Geosiphon pyriformis]|nr:hypothetical protein G9A89_022487 [Geosiphon pyriformis]